MELAQLQARIGKDLGVSRWFVVDQSRIDTFADCVEDHQYIHVNPELAKATPLGTTVAHGFLTLSLLSAMGYDAAIMPAAKFALNYGFDKVRFLNVVKSGQRVRGHFTLLDLTAKAPGTWLIKYGISVEIEHEEKPALGAQWLVQFVT